MLVKFGVALSSRTSFCIGGPVAHWFEVTPDEAPEAVQFASRRAGPLVILGAGTNVLVHDDGWPGTVLQVAPPEEAFHPIKLQTTDHVMLTVDGGVSWDTVAGYCATRGWQGIECLSGIPGTVGAAPVQNIGAYGQAIADVIAQVQAVEVPTGSTHTFTGTDCQFGYRSSIFNRQENIDRYLITRVTLRLHPGRAPHRAHPEISAMSGSTTGLVREAVLRIRRRKEMLAGQLCSAGSFFKNPVGNGASRVPAAQLIEEAGFTKGYRRGNAALSDRHVLALVNLGNATAADIVALASEIQDGVARKSGIILEPEVRLIGFPDYPFRRP